MITVVAVVALVFLGLLLSDHEIPQDKQYIFGFTMGALVMLCLLGGNS